MSDPRPEPSAPEAGSAAPSLSLRQARERAGLPVESLAATLKVTARQIEALESGRYDELPDLTFARTLALSVCRQLKLDPAPVLAHMPALAQVRLGEPEGALHTPLPRAGDSVLARAVSLPGQALSTPVALALLLLVVALALWFLLPQRPAPPPVPPAQPLPAPVPAPTPPAAARVGLAPAVAPAAAPTPEPLRLTARQTAWVQITGASGQVLLQRHLQVGETLGFAEDLPLALVIGRADAVEVSVRGQTLDLAAHSRNNVARLQVR